MPKLGQSETTKLYLPSTKDAVNEQDRAFVVMRSKLLLGDITDVNKQTEDTDKAITLLSQLIQDWNFEDDNGQKLPITTEWVNKLELADFGFLSAWMEENIKTATGGLAIEEKKTSSVTSIPITEAPKI